jgi:hypothetical protein
VHEDCTLEVLRIQRPVSIRENQITLDVLFNLMSIDMFKLSGYTSDKAISVEMLAPIKI